MPLKNKTGRRASRRDFLTATTAVASAALCSGAIGNKAFAVVAEQAPVAKTDSTKMNTNIYTSVKWGMIKEPGSVKEKFALMKELGYDGMELSGPGSLKAAEVRAASDATGMPVHGIVNGKHWKIRMSDPDPKVQADAVAIMEVCLRETAAFGGDSVLLVPGAVRSENENHDQVWQRSIVNIRKLLPLASKLGVRILIENVWNGFCETPEQLRDYLDEIASPWVGAYFDIGNVQKFSPSAQWIRTLGSRIVKLDAKGWGIKAGFCKIGDGDVDWADVRKALAEIKFTGWSTAEVSGGKRDRLLDISQRMDKYLRGA